LGERDDKPFYVRKFQLQNARAVALNWLWKHNQMFS